MGISIGVCCWSGYRYYTIAFPVADTQLDCIPPGTLEKTEFVAVTDLGRRLPLMQWKVDAAALASFDFSKTFLNFANAKLAIARTPPDAQSNCHGWVFTGGSFHMAGEAVEWILQDNRYWLTDQPRANDVVIYRDSQGNILHTGLVRGVLGDGTIMIESKWSIGSRYLHRLEDQPYSLNISFYHTDRPWHYIGMDVAAPKSRPSPK